MVEPQVCSGEALARAQQAAAQVLITNLRLVADLASTFRGYGIALSEIGSEATIGLTRPHNALIWRRNSV
jgi:DNA-directed RNA polymerase sigma subunit (sigma70/sigma32)